MKRADCCRVFGHRGAAARVLENTIASFAYALDAGAAGVEIDVRLSADGVPMVLHDATLDRTGQGHGRVCDYTGAVLQTFGVPTLEETVALCVSRGAELNVELKEAEAWPAAMEVVRASNLAAGRAAAGDAAAGRVWWSSFDLELMARVAEDGQPVGLLYSQRRGPITLERLREDARRLRARALHLPGDLVDILGPAVCGLGCPVYVWTVNDPEAALRFADAGVAALYSDDPGLIIDTLRRRG